MASTRTCRVHDSKRYLLVLLQGMPTGSEYAGLVWAHIHNDSALVLFPVFTIRS